MMLKISLIPVGAVIVVNLTARKPLIRLHKNMSQFFTPGFISGRIILHGTILMSMFWEYRLSGELQHRRCNSIEKESLI